MKYEKAMAEVVEFDNSDVVTASVQYCILGNNNAVKPCEGPNSETIGGCWANISIFDPGVEEGPGAGSW